MEFCLVENVNNHDTPLLLTIAIKNKKVKHEKKYNIKHSTWQYNHYNTHSIGKSCTCIKNAETGCK